MSQILVVDDSDVIRSDLSEAITDRGYQVVCAEDGQKAIDILKENGNISVMITDLNMPIMNGMDVLDKVRNELNNSDLKVLIMSTETSSMVRKRCKALKISGWILKPMRIETVLTVIDKLMTTLKSA